LASDLDELHEFAQSIGLKRQWFQDQTFPHYDVTRNKRYAAIRAGATELKRGEFPDDLLVKKPDGTYEKYDARLRRALRGDHAPDS